MLKHFLLKGIRAAGGMQGLDRLYFFWNRLRHRKKNQAFRAAHPSLPLPPPYMLYEAYRLDYEAYITDGAATAQWLLAQCEVLMDLKQARLLEWGCGPARIVRHLPALLPGASVHACDYNMATIDWCRKHISGVQFSVNALWPPLPYVPASFDLVYALSVFTHLSEENHGLWLDELHRVLRPGGLLLFTAQGRAFSKKLTASERKNFLEGQLVVRAQVKEGHRSFSAFQPEAYLQKLFGTQWAVRKFIPGTQQDWGPEQDVWIVGRVD